MPNMLVIDDDPEVHRIIEAYGATAGWAVEAASTAAEGLARIQNALPDLIVLDLMLPDRSGWEVLADIRARHPIYLLVLSARSAEAERILGLARGADDYMVKPFSPGELLARCQALLRRPRGVTPAVGEGAVAVGGLSIDADRHTVRVDGHPVELTALEFTLLATMARHPGRVYTRGQLIDVVWGGGDSGYDRLIDVHIGRLRKKLEDGSDRPRFIETVRGVGYRLRDPGEADR